MAYVRRRADGTISEVFSVRQFEGQEAVPDDHPEVVAIRTPVGPSARQQAVADAKAKLDAAVASAAVPPALKDALTALRQVLA